MVLFRNILASLVSPSLRDCIDLCTYPLRAICHIWTGKNSVNKPAIHTFSYGSNPLQFTAIFRLSQIALIFSTSNLPTAHRSLVSLTTCLILAVHCSAFGLVGNYKISADFRKTSNTTKNWPVTCQHQAGFVTDQWPVLHWHSLGFIKQ